MKSKPDKSHWWVPLILVGGILSLWGFISLGAAILDLNQGEFRGTYLALTRQVILLALVHIFLSSLLAIFRRQNIKKLWQDSGIFHFLNFLFILGIFLLTNPIYTGHLVWFRVTFLLLGVLFLVRAMGALVKYRKSKETFWVNITLSGLALLFILTLLEGGTLLVSRSHSYNFALASRHWFAQSWELNHLGFRENPNRYVTRLGKRVLVLGDSFTAGHGVQEEERFSRILEKNLSKRHENIIVHNLGTLGADPALSLENLNSFRKKPDLIVIQWYVNDIDMAHVAETGISRPGFSPYKGLGKFPIWWVQHSQILNYLYFLFPNRDQNQVYRDFLHQAFISPATMDRHKLDLDNIMDVGFGSNTPMVAVVFPFLQAPDEEKEGIDEVIKHFEWTEVPVVDVRKLIDDLEPSARIVNTNDGHPSPELHRRVGEALSELINQKGLLK